MTRHLFGLAPLAFKLILFSETGVKLTLKSPADFPALGLLALTGLLLPRRRRA